MMSLTTTRSHESLASALTAERYGQPHPPTYQQMRAIARASRHDNTCAVGAFPATATPDVWPGEPEPWGWTMCRDCGSGAPVTDMVGGQCLECWHYERERRP